MDHVFVYAAFVSKNNNARITEISAIRTNRLGMLNTKSVVSAFTSKVEEDFKRVLLNFKDSILCGSDKVVVVSHLVEIQKPLLRSECERINEPELFSGRTWIDVSQLAWPLHCNGMINSRSVEDLSKYHGIKYQPTDTASTCTAIGEIYGHMMRRYKTALTGEEIMRDVGGETLENLRKIVGF